MEIFRVGLDPMASQSFSLHVGCRWPQVVVPRAWAAGGPGLPTRIDPGSPLLDRDWGQDPLSLTLTTPTHIGSLKAAPIGPSVIWVLGPPALVQIGIPSWKGRRGQGRRGRMIAASSREEGAPAKRAVHPGCRRLVQAVNSELSLVKMGWGAMGTLNAALRMSAAERRRKANPSGTRWRIELGT